MSSDADAVAACERKGTPTPTPAATTPGTPRTPAAATPPPPPPASGAAEGDGEGSRTPSRSSSEYETGRVSCDTCGLSVSFRDEATGGFSLKEWQEHKETCEGGVAAGEKETTVHPPTKRRRAKRTEEERKAYLGSDPYVERFEAYRVLCKSCDKWIRLRPNSTYCSIPWDAHRKSCLAKKINSKNVYALDERNALFAKDPDVRKFDAERVLCNICDSWLPLNPDNHLFAVQTWLQHRAACQQSRPPPPPTPPKQESATRPPSPAGDPAPSPSFHDLNPANYTPAHESRRRNAEQRAATLRADSLIAEVEPNRVFCSLCQKWVQLRQDSSYCAYPWLQHRGKCLARHQRRAAKAAEVAEAKARKLAHVHSAPPRPARSISAELESEDDARRESPEDIYRRHRERERDRDRARFHAASYRRAYEHRHAPYPHPHPHPHHAYRPGTGSSSTSSSARVIRAWNPDVPRSPGPPAAGDRDVDMDAEGDDADADADGERDPEMAPPSPASQREREREPRPSSSHRVMHHREREYHPYHTHAHPHAHAHRRPFAFSPPPAHPPAPPAVPSSSSSAAGTGGPVHLDLDSQAGRRNFVYASIVHLRGTTYEASDEMSVSALVAYLNAAVPVDKYEDFDTAEVVRVLGSLRERGRVRLEGDLVWVC